MKRRLQLLRVYFSNLFIGALIGGIFFAVIITLKSLVNKFGLMNFLIAIGVLIIFPLIGFWFKLGMELRKEIKEENKRLAERKGNVSLRD